eukprot:gene14556-17202_t
MGSGTTTDNNNDEDFVTPQVEDEERDEVDQPESAIFIPKQAVVVEPPKVEQDQNVTIAMVVAFYFFISISLVFLNKALMKNLNFNYPVFITWYQQIVSFALVYLMCKLSRNTPSLSFLPDFEFKLETAKQVVPLTFVLAGMISLNNLCLQYVEVSFYQTSPKATGTCFIVFLGFVLGSIGEANFSWIGLFYGISSSFFVALYGIYVKRVLPVCGGNEWRLTIYNTAISIVVLIPLIVLAGETQTILEEPVLWTGYFWFMMTLAGVAGYFISIAVFMQIKYTSPLTNAISATVKSCVQTILAVMIWGNEITFENAFGIFLVIGGSFLYSYVRYQEMNRK